MTIICHSTHYLQINSKAPLDLVSLIGCCLGQGFGGAQRMAQVTPGSTCAIWGLGAIGLATGESIGHSFGFELKLIVNYYQPWDVKTPALRE